MDAEARRVEEIRLYKTRGLAEPKSIDCLTWDDVDFLLARIETLTTRLAEAERVAKQNELAQQKDRFEAEQRVAALDAMIERKNTALSRPCIACGYEPKVVTPALSPAPKEDK